MAKFARIIENDKGEQLLLKLQPSEEHEDLADMVYTFEAEGAIMNLTLGGLDWDKAEESLIDYPEEKGLKILADPMDFFNKLTE